MSGRNYGLRHARAVVNAAFESHDGVSYCGRQTVQQTSKPAITHRESKNLCVWQRIRYSFVKKT
ncbi:hypothetical protein OUZ56_022227 [Daphnia magna]|uniref:Uncharacterized protein n=1 Tax=Daphnia magna TaxID=35525 RepID=A0ABR0AW05_9CRUS|nr:hypothetical protein OUZ56_022227 [Daphnia magna]